MKIFQPKYLWGKLNPRYTGPQAAKKMDSKQATGQSAMSDFQGENDEKERVVTPEDCDIAADDVADIFIRHSGFYYTGYNRRFEKHPNVTISGKNGEKFDNFEDAFEKMRDDAADAARKFFQDNPDADVDFERSSVLSPIGVDYFDYLSFSTAERELNDAVIKATEDYTVSIDYSTDDPIVNQAIRNELGVKFLGKTFPGGYVSADNGDLTYSHDTAESKSSLFAFCGSEDGVRDLDDLWERMKKIDQGEWIDDDKRRQAASNIADCLIGVQSSFDGKYQYKFSWDHGDYHFNNHDTSDLSLAIANAKAEEDFGKYFRLKGLGGQLEDHQYDAAVYHLREGYRKAYSGEKINRVVTGRILSSDNPKEYIKNFDVAEYNDCLNKVFEDNRDEIPPMDTIVNKAKKAKRPEDMYREDEDYNPNDDDVW